MLMAIRPMLGSYQIGCLRRAREAEDQLVRGINANVFVVIKAIRLYARLFVRDGVRLRYSKLPARLRQFLTVDQFIDIALRTEAACEPAAESLQMKPEQLVVFADDEAERNRRAEIYAKQWETIELTFGQEQEKVDRTTRPVVSSFGEPYRSLEQAASAMRLMGFKSADRKKIREALQEKKKCCGRYWHYQGEEAAAFVHARAVEVVSTTDPRNRFRSVLAAANGLGVSRRQIRRWLENPSESGWRAERAQTAPAPLLSIRPMEQMSLFAA